MTTGSYNESDYENAVIEVLRSMKWEYMYGPDVERDYSDPTLPDVFEYQVRKLNKGVPDEAVNDAIRQVRGIAGGSVVVRTRFSRTGCRTALTARVVWRATTRRVLGIYSSRRYKSR